MRPLHRPRSTRLVWPLLAACAFATLGCLLDQPISGDDLVPEFSPLPPTGPSDTWEEDLAEERRRRDDPSDPSWRGSFVIEVTGDEVIELDSTSLGEATYKWVERDLSGTPPHCMITLVDRTPDDEQRQGYLVIRHVSERGCEPIERSFPIVVGDEPPSIDTVSVSALQIDVEQDGRTIYRSYEVAEGTVRFSQGRNGGLAGSIEARFDRLVEEGDQIDERAVSVELIGSFEAIE